MDEVRDDVIQQALIVGDEHDPQLTGAELVDAVGDDAQGVDVEPESVSSIMENLGSSMAICRISPALLLSPKSPRMTARRRKLPIDLQEIHLLVEFLVVAGGVEVCALAEAGLQAARTKLAMVTPGTSLGY